MSSLVVSVNPGLWPLLVLFLVSNAYGTALLVGLAFARSRAVFQSEFTSRKYYLLMGWAPLSYVGLSVFLEPRYGLLFVLAGSLGVLGELLVSVHFRYFFREPIWTYSHRAVLAGYTSTINFLPWAVGALLFHASGRVLMPDRETSPWPAMFSASLAVAMGVVVSVLLERLTRARRGVFSLPAFAIFCLPIATVAVALGVLHDVRYVGLMLLFSVVGFATEYAYGRSMSLFFDRALWTYNHWPIDEGHSSFVTFPLWALGGLYFFFIAAALGL